MTGPLDGRVAVVTGGATGIGFAIARRLRADGARIVLAGLADADVEAALGRLGDPATRVAGFAGDLAMPGTADRLLATAVETFAQVDICVNNAGGGVIAPTLAHTEETLQATIANNLWTTLRTCLAVPRPRAVRPGPGGRDRPDPGRPRRRSGRGGGRRRLPRP